MWAFLPTIRGLQIYIPLKTVNGVVGRGSFPCDLTKTDDRECA